MDFFRHEDGTLHCEDVPLPQLADAVGTPAYVYSLKTVQHHVRAIQDAFAELDPLICYAVKANGNLALLRELARLGTGFDIVSGGELHRVLSSGCAADRVVFSGVGKTDDEMRAALDAEVLMFNTESEEEVRVLGAVAQAHGKVAGVAVRVNPDVDPKTHRYISTGQKESKFGVDLERGEALAREVIAHPALELRGIQCHIGSQITSVEPFEAAVRRTARLATDLKPDAPHLAYLNMGGGYGIYYKDKTAPAVSAYAEAIVPLVKSTGLRLVMEPGRLIVGNAGVLLTRVLFNKHSGDRRFVITDAGMNDLIRPSLYGGYHRIWPARGEAPPPLGSESEHPPCDIVGPVCESGDFFAKDRPLPDVTRGDILVVFSVGAYGMSMASNYNDRVRPAEVLVEDATYRVIRERETLVDLTRHDRPEADVQTLSESGARDE